MNNLLTLLDKLKNDTNPPAEQQEFTLQELNNFKNTNYNDYIHVILYLYLEGNMLDGNIDELFDKQDEILIHVTTATKQGNYSYLYTITKTRRTSMHWIFREHFQKFITLLCSNLIPSYYIITNNMLKNVNPLETFTNMILPLIIQTIDTQLLIKKLENKIDETNNRIEELENIIYYSPEIGTEYLNAKNNFEKLANQI